MNLSGRNIWLTGASSGIGEAVAVELARRGASIAVTARRGERLQELAERTHGAVRPFPGDVTDRDAVHDLARRITQELGGIDIAIANAGVWHPVDVREFDAEVFRDSLDVNVMGVVHVIEAVLPGMRERGRGVIAGVASVAGYRGLPNAAAYGSSKAALINLFESLRIDLAPDGVRAVTINPGFVDTEMTEVNRFPMPFMVEPDDAAQAIADGLEAGRNEIVFPLPMAIATKAMRLLPVSLHARAWQAARQRR